MRSPIDLSPAAPAVSNRKRRLGELLIDAGLLDELQLKSALSEQRKWGGRLGRTLVEMGFIKEDAMTRALSEQLALPAVNLDAFEAPKSALELLRVDLAERYGVFPVSGDAHKKVLEIATSDPTNQEMLKDLEFQTGMRIQISVAGLTAIDRAIRREYYGEKPKPLARGPAESATGVDSLFEIETGPAYAPVPLTISSPSSSAAAASVVAPPAAEKRLEEMAQRMGELEKALSAQTRVLRSMLELMFEKGVLTREDYLAKVRGPQPR